LGGGSLYLLARGLILDFTNYALRWDADTYSATVVGTQIVKQVPWAGSALFHLLTGGAQFGETTVLRFYVLHSFLLPGSVFALIFYHFWRVRKDGMAERPL
jgi:quinol-cytochrome oxidoreductase complex cytochrome b subunit